MIQSYLAPAFVEPRELYKASGYEDVIEVYSHISNPGLIKVAIDQMKVLAAIEVKNIDLDLIRR